VKQVSLIPKVRKTRSSAVKTLEARVVQLEAELDHLIHRVSDLEALNADSTPAKPDSPSA